MNTKQIQLISKEVEVLKQRMSLAGQLLSNLHDAYEQLETCKDSIVDVVDIIEEMAEGERAQIERKEKIGELSVDIMAVNPSRAREIRARMDVIQKEIDKYNAECE